jgi:hypothetical protein
MINKFEEAEIMRCKNNSFSKTIIPKKIFNQLSKFGGTIEDIIIYDYSNEKNINWEVNDLASDGIYLYRILDIDNDKCSCQFVYNNNITFKSKLSDFFIPTYLELAVKFDNNICIWGIEHDNNLIRNKDEYAMILYSDYLINLNEGDSYCQLIRRQHLEKFKVPIVTISQIKRHFDNSFKPIINKKIKCNK